MNVILFGVAIAFGLVLHDLVWLAIRYPGKVRTDRKLKEVINSLSEDLERHAERERQKSKKSNRTVRSTAQRKSKKTGNKS